MQQIFTATRYVFGKRVCFISNHASNAVLGKSLISAARQCTCACTSSTEPDDSIPVPKHSGVSTISGPKPTAVSLTSANAADTSGKDTSLSLGSAIITARQYPSTVKRKAAAALRKKQRAKDAVPAHRRKARESAAKLHARTKVKAAAAKEKAKILAAKEKVQKAKAEKAQRKALLGKRNPSAYDLFLLGAIKALGHLPHLKKFETISAQYKELTSEQRQTYVDAAAKNKTALLARRAAIWEANPVKVHSPRTAYLLFCQGKFAEVKAQNASAKFADIVRLIAKQWRELGESEKLLLKARLVALKSGAVQGVRATSSSSAA